MKIIANEILPVYESDRGEKLVNARELHQQLMSKQEFAHWIKRRIDNYGFAEGEDFLTTLTKSTGGRPLTEYLLLLDTAKEMAMLENNEQGRAIRKYFIQVEKQQREQQPKSIEDLIIMQAQSLKSVRQEQEQLKQENQVFRHRLDTLDRVDEIGDLQQRLNAMIKKYAWQEGYTFSKAWKEFKQSYNTAFRTNVTSRMNNYKEKHGLKSLTFPQYLSLTGQLEDAVRVADKLLNKSSTDNYIAN